jgi:catechol 2,3-dioxygenase-like lactoylglutathione lyase family enzyme
MNQRVHRLGIAAALGVAVAMPVARANAQGQCKGRPAEHTPACDTTPAKAPFASTGWKTVAMDHFVMDAVDYKKEAAYYATLMNWKIRSDNGKEAVLDIGDFSTVIIRGGYQPPAPQAPPAPPPGADTAGRGGRGRGGPRQAPQVSWDVMAVQIAPWDAKKVEAELKKRGFTPEHITDKAIGYEAFRVKDPDGFDVEIGNGAYTRMRNANKNKPGMAVADAPFAPTDWKSVWLDHISFAVTNYKESTAWYQTLLGWMPQGDEGSQNETWMCDDCGNILIRGGNPNNTARPMPAVRHAVINHISFGISPFDADKTKADLEARHLSARMDTGGPKDIHDPTAYYKSYHTQTPGGWDLQISNGNKENRTVR